MVTPPPLDKINRIHNECFSCQVQFEPVYKFCINSSNWLIVTEKFFSCQNVVLLESFPLIHGLHIFTNKILTLSNCGSSREFSFNSGSAYTHKIIIFLLCQTVVLLESFLLIQGLHIFTNEILTLSNCGFSGGFSFNSGSAYSLFTKNPTRTNSFPL